mmetsp:Transcript_28145/g.51453  ORF Transcript_28145/g.51453 Transcript_28145/m.51453 type:complete len:84 (+) Transcript_28145:123-374(+)
MKRICFFCVLKKSSLQCLYMLFCLGGCFMWAGWRNIYTDVFFMMMMMMMIMCLILGLCVHVLVERRWRTDSIIYIELVGNYNI